MLATALIAPEMRPESVVIASTTTSVMTARTTPYSAIVRHKARSAGSYPGPAVHPHGLEALAEIGIDASDHQPHRLDQEALEWADVIVATCDDACPVIPGKRYVSWELPDPKPPPLERVREIRTEIEHLVAQLVEELDREAAVA